MELKFKEYIVDIVNDPNYKIGSTDNFNIYDTVYFNGEFQPSSKHGIRITKDGQKIASAIICETQGATGVYTNSFIHTQEILLLCCSNTVYSFTLPELKLNWRREFDSATCFAIHSFKGDYIIHGEVEIKRIDIRGNVKWSFSAKDIFVTKDGLDAIKLTEDEIEVTDWEGNKYILDENGRLEK
jgi:hypothetical protein